VTNIEAFRLLSDESLNEDQRRPIVAPKKGKIKLVPREPEFKLAIPPISTKFVKNRLQEVQDIVDSV
jgi:hypothetical protein